jgi:hypothetical protein
VLKLVISIIVGSSAVRLRLRLQLQLRLLYNEQQRPQRHWERVETEYSNTRWRSLSTVSVVSVVSVDSVCLWCLVTVESSLDSALKSTKSPSCEA